MINLRVNLFDNRCLGLELWKSKSRHIELWICAPFYTIPKHKHPFQDSRLVFLFGWANLTKITKIGCIMEVLLRPWIKKRVYNIYANEYHWFSSLGLPLVFLNISEFIDNKKPISASKNIQKYE